MFGSHVKGARGLGGAAGEGPDGHVGVVLCCLVAQEGMGGAERRKQGDVGRSAARHHSSLLSLLLLMPYGNHVLLYADPDGVPSHRRRIDSPTKCNRGGGADGRKYCKNGESIFIGT